MYQTTIDSGIFKGYQAIVLKPFHATSSHPHSYFDFLALPPELRNKIYQYFFAITDSGNDYQTVRISTYQDATITDPKLRYTHSPLALLKVNKQVRQEALPVFYSQSLFILANHRALCGFLEDNIGAKAHLGHVRLDTLLDYKRYNAFEELKGCLDLKSLELYSDNFGHDSSSVSKEACRIFHSIAGPLDSDTLNEREMVKRLRSLTFVSRSPSQRSQFNARTLRRMIARCWVDYVTLHRKCAVKKAKRAAKEAAQIEKARHAEEETKLDDD